MNWSPSRLQMVGTQRSGSNLVRLILDGLGPVFAPPSAHELRDFRSLYPIYTPISGDDQKFALLRDMAHLVELNALPWPPGSVSIEQALVHLRGSSLAHFVIALYDAGAWATNSLAWVSKCLENVHYLDDLESAELNIIYLHLVRDPRDVALSFIKAPIGPKDPTSCALAWRHDQLAAIAQRAKLPKDRWLEVRYEDIVADPGEALRLVCQALGIPWTPEALNFYSKEEAKRTAALSPLWSNLSSPLDPGRAGAHNDDSNRGVVAEVERVVGDMMPEFGYSPAVEGTVSNLTREEIARAAKRDEKLREAAARSRNVEAERIHERRVDFLQHLARPHHQS